jgi:hypothetical protein
MQAKDGYAGPNKAKLRQSGVSEHPEGQGLRVETKLQFASLGGCFGFTPHFLIRSFKGSKSSYFFHRSLSVKLILQALQRSINRLSLSYNDFWHRLSYVLFRSREG